MGNRYDGLDSELSQRLHKKSVRFFEIWAIMLLTSVSICASIKFMSKNARKVLDEWKKRVPSHANREDVEKVIKEFLSDCSRSPHGGGSHLVVVKHPVFQQLGLFDGHGQFSVKMDKKKVTHCYLKDIVKAIEVLEMMRRIDSNQ